MDEKFLYHIWDEGHLKQDLKTVSGNPVRIIYAGQFNRNRGPDFSNVTLSLDGTTLRGDVELHLNTYDWTAHKHYEDPYYNNVVLHVVFRHSGNASFTVKQNAELVDILELQYQLSEDISKLIEQHEEAAVGTHPRYCDLLSVVDSSGLESILCYWGKRRMQNKEKRFNAGLMAGSFDQILYEGIMEALGYDKNKINMQRLAQTIPLSVISEWQKQGITTLQLISVLASASGLLQRSRKQLPQEFSLLLTRSFEEQPFWAKNIPIDWQLFRVRPGNHPIHRLVSFLPLLMKALPSGLLNYFREKLRLHEHDNRHGMIAFKKLFAESILPGTESFPKPGESILRNIILNVLLPVLHLHADKLGYSTEMDKLEIVYRNYPGLPDNHITRFMSLHFNPSHHKLVNSRAILQQGLIELYYRYCQYHFCAECTDNQKYDLTMAD
jgi:hypothetical protein